MITIDKVSTCGWEPAIRGMRNPKNSWDRSDSVFNPWDYPTLGCRDLELANALAKGGPVHAKYRRMIDVYLDITAPLYWWKEHDQYKVGTTTNSCSTMHKIHAKEFTIEDFSCEHLIDTCLLERVINELNIYRDIYNNYDKQTEQYKTEFSKKHIWLQMIQLLPSSYNQKRTVKLNYQVLKNMYHARKTHKLKEWRDFCALAETLPYFKEICIEV